MTESRNDRSNDQYSKEHTLPSGLIVKVEEWLLDDLTRVSETKGRGRQSALSKLVSRCSVVENEKGLYGLEPGSKVDADLLLTGDRLVLLILQRIISHGKNFDFDFRCIDSDCNHKTPWCLDLRRLLLQEVPPLGVYDGEEWINDYGLECDIDKGLVWDRARWGDDPIELGDDTIFWRPLSNEGIECFVNGNAFPYTDGEGNELTWKLFTGKDEIAIRNQSSGAKKRELASIMQRITSIEGVRTEGKRGIENKEAWLRRWTMREFDTFGAHTNDYEAGIESDLEVVCEECSLIQVVQLPTDNPGFFSPKSAKKRFGKG